MLQPNKQPKNDEHPQLATTFTALVQSVFNSFLFKPINQFNYQSTAAIHFFPLLFYCSSFILFSSGIVEICLGNGMPSAFFVLCFWFLLEEVTQWRASLKASVPLVSVLSAISLVKIRDSMGYGSVSHHHF